MFRITDIAYQVFFDAIEAQGRALLRAALDTNGTDVTPPNIILDHAQLLREVMTVHSSSLGGDDTDAEQNKGFTRVLDAIIDPAVEMTVTAAEDKQRARPTWDASVFVLNCLTYLQDVLGVQPFAAEKRQVLEALIQERVNRLIEEHVSSHSITHSVWYLYLLLVCQRLA
jgi:conserved oligomeric Golgi complex subunit 6